MSATAGWRVLSLMPLREQPLRSALIVLAIALGVALGAAVYLINAAALSDFERATRQLLGTADLSVRAAASGFDEQLFVTLARNPQVETASPMLDLNVTLPNRRQSLEVLGVDVFRAARLQPALAAAIGPNLTRLFTPDAIVLTRRVAEDLAVQRPGPLPIVLGSEGVTLRVIDVAASDTLTGSVGIMDIASAQWTLGYLHRLNRIDLRLRPDVDVAQFRRQLAASLPPGTVVSTPRLESAREADATRAYRVNLNLLASVALLTAAFLVFSTQTLAVLRRRTALALLRALGMTRRQLQAALLGEGALIGLLGALVGVPLGALLAAAVLHYRGADLGNAALRSTYAALVVHPLTLLVFLTSGVAAAVLGAWLPAREAARRAPALALHAGDEEPALRRVSTTPPGVVLLTVGAALSFWPARAGIPWSGYLSIAALLLGAVLLIPLALRVTLAAIPPTGRVVIDLCVAQLRGSAGSTTVSLAGVVVSFSLMVAMAIMVHSFRDSFELWLVKQLPADLQLRAAIGSDTGALSAEQQRRITQLPSVARAEFRRVQPLYLNQREVALIARDISLANANEVLPLVPSRSVSTSPSSTCAQLPCAWVSEALADLDGDRPGMTIELPLAGRRERFRIAGIWRDYQHAAGAIVIDRRDYLAFTGDGTATEGAIWQRPRIDAAVTGAAIRRELGPQAVEIIASTALRERSLSIFDRVFAITYALEAIAVLVGLGGISVAASSAALARRAQFGMLRHLGMLRRQILALLACEGVALSTLAGVFGLALGGALSLILVYVINRRSFHWSIDLAIPWLDLTLLSAALIATAALTAVWSGRSATTLDAVRAVREDW